MTFDQILEKLISAKYSGIVDNIPSILEWTEDNQEENYAKLIDVVKVTSQEGPNFVALALSKTVTFKDEEMSLLTLMLRLGATQELFGYLVEARSNIDLVTATSTSTLAIKYEWINSKIHELIRDITVASDLVTKYLNEILEDSINSNIEDL